MSIQLKKDSGTSNRKIGHASLSSPQLDELVLGRVDLSSLELNNNFWQFSLQQWKNPPLQKILIRLQDEQGFRINLLLFSMWLSLENKLIKEYLADIYKFTQAWHDAIVKPLRTVRKSLPTQLQQSALKAQIQSSEIQAEQIEQALLFNFSAHIPRLESSETTSQEVLTGNLLASQIPQSELSLLLQAYLSGFSD